ncbi:uncharacterized protein [Littorina saxatilis]|uniref:C-type lectin domain-containing protein n=1 Tax=Littorina saxatilis TaxID=31220 RepID=A0AAN9C550_9CAEN
MTTATQIVAVLLLSANHILAEVIADSAASGSLWKRSYRVQMFATSPSSISLFPARSTLECLTICQLKPVSDHVCFNTSSKSCFADTNSMSSSSDTADPDLLCYFRCSLARGYSLVNGRCLKVHDTSPAKTDYSVAAATCSGEGGHLFDLLTSQDEVAMTLLIDQLTGVLPWVLLLGAKRSGGNFYWTDGSLMSSLTWLWDSGQPGASEECVVVKVSNGRLHDIYCPHTAFVCQVDLY